jgi:hypothetical protein
MSITTTPSRKIVVSDIVPVHAQGQQLEVDPDADDVTTLTGARFSPVTRPLRFPGHQTFRMWGLERLALDSHRNHGMGGHLFGGRFPPRGNGRPSRRGPEAVGQLPLTALFPAAG